MGPKQFWNGSQRSELRLLADDRCKRRLGPALPKLSSGLTAPKAFGVAEVEKPQPGGAGCGYTSLFEAIVSNASVIRDSAVLGTS